MTTMTADKTFEGLTAEQWRAKASGERNAEAESWERSDTDGFLTQWAHATIAREYLLKAELAERDGKWEFFALFDLEGNHIPAEQVDTQYGPSWRIFDPETHQTLGWFNESKARNPQTAKANNAKKGYSLGKVRVPAVVRAGGNSVTVTYYYARADRWATEVEVVNNGSMLPFTDD